MPRGTLNIGMPGLGPYVATLYDARPLQAKFSALTTHEGMFAMGEDGEWEPRLVKSFDSSADGLTWRMNLREGVMWHRQFGNWGPFNAGDLIWSIKEVARVGSSHPQSSNVREVFSCDGCELARIDDLTVELNRPTPTYQLTWYSQTPIPSSSAHSVNHYQEVGLERAVLHLLPRARGSRWSTGPTNLGG